MFQLAAFATIALSLAVSVSSLVVPRATPPPGWNAELLENYDTYHARYMALSCETQHGSTFFAQCCHPLLATQTLATARPAQCIPSTSSAAAAASTATDSGDDSDDDDLPFCDSGDDDDDSTTPAAPAATQAPAPAVTTPPPAVTTPAPAAKKVATPSPVATPASNSAGSTVNTGGVATFYYQNGNAGACGQKNPDTALIAAIDGARYGDLSAVSPLCGKQVKITNQQNQKSVVVTIKDACPTCENSNSIDLSVAAFETISDLNTGEVPIEWEFL